MKIKILIPIYNDWQSISKLLDEINLNILNLDYEVSVVIVNDASNHDRQDEEKNLENIKSVKILNMKINQGHARCIATGLKYIFEKEDFDYIIPMDGDGEDKPEEIKEFLNHIKDVNKKPIVGERIKRSESLLFQICYKLHKLITLTFTGKSIKFGNFTCLPKLTVEKLINDKSTWNSFSGSLSKVENDLISVSSIRGTRYFGPSKMSFKNLLIHSLSSVSVFKINVLIRSILFVLVYLFLIQQKITIVMLIPIILVFVLVVSVFAISKRENLDELNNSLLNISNIDDLK